MLVGELERPERRLRAPVCVSCGGTRRTADSRTTDLSLRSAFVRAKKLERQYATRLRTLARAIDHIVRGYDPLLASGLRSMEQHLRDYARTINRWARAVSERMVTEVAAHDDRSWRRASATLGDKIKAQIESAPVGKLFRERTEAQVALITSLPTEAAERVRRIATENSHAGARTASLAEDIYATGEVTRARADLIARTETARTSTEFTRVRAEHAGSTHFRWMTVGDAHVRKTHKKLAGTIHAWNDPPECDPGHKALPGCIWNCRCFAEPLFDDEDL